MQMGYMMTMTTEYVRTHRDMYRVVRRITTTEQTTMLDVRDMAGSERVLIEQRTVPMSREDVLQQLFLNTIVSLDEMKDFGLTLDEVKATFEKALKKVGNEVLASERVD